MRVSANVIQRPSSRPWSTITSPLSGIRWPNDFMRPEKRTRAGPPSERRDARIVLRAATRIGTPSAARSAWSTPAKRSPTVRLGPLGTVTWKRPWRSVTTVAIVRSGAPLRRTRLTARTCTPRIGWPADSVSCPVSTARLPHGTRSRPLCSLRRWPPTVARTTRMRAGVPAAALPALSLTRTRTSVRRMRPRSSFALSTPFFSVVGSSR